MKNSKNCITIFRMICPPHYSYKNGTCLPTCPAEFYSKKEYDTLYYMQVVTGFLAIFSSVIVSIPYIFLKEKRKWPQPLHLTIFIIVAIFGLNLVMTLAAGKYENIICKNKTTIADSKHAKCLIFGVLNYTPLLVAVFIWFFSCLHLNLTINGVLLPSIKIQAIFVYIISIGIPVILTIIAIGKNSIGGDPNSISCNISSTKNDGWWIDTYWFIPIGFLAVLGLNLIGQIFVKTFLRHDIEGVLHFLKTQVRLLCFLLLVLIAILIVDFFRLYTRIKQTEIETGIKNWYVCLYTEWAKNSTNIDNMCKKNLNVLPNYAIVTFVIYTVIVSATLFPIVFIDKHIINFWKKILFNYSWTPTLIKYNQESKENIKSRPHSNDSGI